MMTLEKALELIQTHIPQARLVGNGKLEVARIEHVTTRQFHHANGAVDLYVTATFHAEEPGVVPVQLKPPRSMRTGTKAEVVRSPKSK